MNQLYFIRHGAVAGNLQRRYIGRTDEHLCEEGRSQIQALQKQCLTADRVFVSPLLRTRQTAEMLFPHQEHTILQDLRETDFGLFEGKNAAELVDNATYRRWVDSGCQGEIPGGESVQKFKARCCAAFCQAMTMLSAEESAAFVVHGGTIMAILEAFARPRREYYQYHIGNGQLLRAVYNQGEITVSAMGNSGV